MGPATCTAPGKIILFGEHAVVYGRPALAVPVHEVQAQATVERRAGGRILIRAVDLARNEWLDEASAQDPLAAIVRLTLDRLEIAQPGGLTILIHSTIPVARGLGSGAAIAVATARALATYFGEPLPPGEISALAFEVEKLHHGTPSGIDNTVVAFEQPVVFRKGEGWQAFHPRTSFWITIADTGVASPTRITVGDVRRAWEADPKGMETKFDAIARVVERAQAAIESGRVNLLGPLMDENQELLVAIGVSAEADQALCRAAREAGAMGAKVSGGGRGGNVIASIDPAQRETISSRLYAAGARHVIITEVK